MKKAGCFKLRFPNLHGRNDLAMLRSSADSIFLAVLFFFAAVPLISHSRLNAQTTPQMNIEPRFWIRVLLDDSMEKCTVRINGGFSVLDSAGQALIPETFFYEKAAPMEIKVSPAGFYIAGRSFAAMELTILPDAPHIFSIDGVEYRGKLYLKALPGATSFEAINIVPIESYLAGVVCAEMSNHTHLEALKAQAVAARTYSLYNKKKYEYVRDWDVMKTTSSQVYLGLKGESTLSWKAVNATWGQVLVCDQNGLDEIFPAYYSSTCGGHTEDANNVFGEIFPPLRGVVCPYCKNVANPAVFFWPMVQFDKDGVDFSLQMKYPKLKALGSIINISAFKQSDYADFSRLTMVKLDGINGNFDLVRAEDLRLTIDPSGTKIKSSACKIVSLNNKWAFISGRGYGHAVGMCQKGAEGMARRGLTAGAILSYYYPSSKISRIY